MKPCGAVYIAHYKVKLRQTNLGRKQNKKRVTKQAKFLLEVRLFLATDNNCHSLMNVYLWPQILKHVKLHSTK